ncbi:MAG: fhs [Actinomycetospora sp.]|nr:fhs [Actinomycetospora sp.]
MSIPSDLDIAQAATLKPLDDVARQMDLPLELLEMHGHDVAKIELDAIEAMADRPRAKYVVVTAITPTPLGEGKTTTTVGLGQAFSHIGKRGVVAIRQPSMGGRRLLAGRADGEVQPPPHRRLPRGDERAQHALRGARQPPLPGQRRGPGPLPRHLAPGARRQRAGAAQHRHRPRRADGRRAARVRLRHHLGLRGHGRARPVQRPRRPACPAGPHRRRLHRRRRRGDRRGHPRRRGDGGAHARRAQAQPHADPREHAGPGARRPLRQHRHGQLLDRRRPHRHPLRRLPRHRGRLRRRHGRRALLQHQVPHLGHDPGRGGRRRDGARAQGALRQP